MFFEYPDHIDNLKVYVKDTKYLSFKEDNSFGGLFFEEVSEYDVESKNKRIFKTYRTQDEKILINYHFDFFHSIIDVLGAILYEHKRNKDILFLINISNLEPLFFKNTYNLFFFNTLNRLNVRYEVLILDSNDVIHISDYHVYTRYLPLIYDTIALLEDTGKPFYSNEVADKKVYLSRKKNFRSKTNEFLFDNKNKTDLMFPDDNRLDDENMVQEFFEKLGFQIVCPEDFESFEDQVKFFSTVNTLVGVTGAGLLNSIFMPRGGTLFELSTPILGHGRESVHHFYKDLAFVKEHLFLCITNLRNSVNIIENIRSNEKLMAVLNG